MQEISDSCWNWCSEQAVIHQSNIDISNLGAVAFVMVVLFLYNLSIEFADEICNYTKWSKDNLRIYGHLAIYFSFIVLASFLLYYAFFS